MRRLRRLAPRGAGARCGACPPIPRPRNCSQGCVRRSRRRSGTPVRVPPRAGRLRRGRFSPGSGSPSRRPRPSCCSPPSTGTSEPPLSPSARRRLPSRRLPLRRLPSRRHPSRRRPPRRRPRRRPRSTFPPKRPPAPPASRPRRSASRAGIRRRQKRKKPPPRQNPGPGPRRTCRRCRRRSRARTPSGSYRSPRSPGSTADPAGSGAPAFGGRGSADAEGGVDSRLSRSFAPPPSRLLRPLPYGRDIVVDVKPESREGAEERIAGAALRLGGIFERVDRGPRRGGSERLREPSG